jgi:hypothetical protein
MFDNVDGEKVIMETPEVLIDRISKAIPKSGIGVFANDLANKLSAQKKEERLEEDLVLLWRASCVVLHGLMSPVKRDKEFMDYEDRQQDVYLLMDEMLDGEKLYGTEAYTRALVFRWRDRIHMDLALTQNKYEVVNMETAIEDNEPALACFRDEVSNMKEYLQDNYDNFAVKWFYLRFVLGYFDKDVYEMLDMTREEYRRSVRNLKKEIKEDKTLLNLWESL